ncbi:MAG: endonuclease MutS2 [Chloroflexi bacterium]|nr:endonuclease MutS2 [Chloroflexota bacterium]
MDEKTLATLEFPKILALLADRTSFAPSREQALALRPSSDLPSVQAALAATTEARRMLAVQPSFGIGGARDLRPLLDRAGIGGVLDVRELLDVLDTLRAVRQVRAALGKLAAEAPGLAARAARLDDCRPLAEDLANALDEGTGEVADRASARLARIRSELRAAHGRLMRRLNELLGAHRLALQDAIITIREGRYVLPVRADARGTLRGIVHDQSASGVTLFVEPFETVELNNRWRELQVEEREEIRRMLAALSRDVAAYGDALRADLNILAEIDLALAKARLAEATDAHEPELGAGPDGWTDLRQARHPLLGRQAVPIDLRLGPDFRVLVVTGPNTGGKTVALKTAGLLTLMAQAGLHLPAAVGSRVRLYQRAFADIGDEQSIEQSLSTFSGHMSNITAMLRQVDDESLVLLDERGAGTDPDEVAALARALLVHLLETGATVVATTHYSELKAFAHLTPGVQNASVAFDLETLQPTYRVVIGTPGRSQALAIAERLGLPAAVLGQARDYLSAEHHQVEALLAELHVDREQAQAARREAEHLLVEARRDAERWQRAWRGVEAERDRVLDEARREAEAELASFREQVQRLVARVEASAERETLAVALREADAAQERVRAKVRPRRPAPPADEPAGEVRVGDVVWLARFGQEGEVVVPPDERGEVEVLVGRLRVRAKAEELRRRARRESPRQQLVTYRLAERPTPPAELHVRGQRAEEALAMVESYLQEVSLAGLPQVRIVHGKGTGVLRQLIREHLARHPLVKSFAPASAREGGEGATVAVMG